ncbi:MAG: cation diffusion facilitator family transporter [Bacteroidota bacterium]
MDHRLKTINLASWIGITGNFILALSKIILGLVSGSLAVIGDGIDSTTDVLSFLVILFATRIIAKKPDQTHPYGHHRAEPLATVVIAFIIFFVGAQLFISSVPAIINRTITEIPSPIAIMVTVFSIIGKLGLAFYQYRIGKKTSSSMLTANAQNMLGDIFISLGVLIGLAFTFWFNIPVIDNIIAMVVGIWIMRTAVMIFIETNTELMEGISDTSIYNKIFETVAQVNGASNPHRTRIRKLSNLYLVDMDIEVSDRLTVAEGHQIAVKVEEKLRQSIDNLYDVTVHVEPLGNVETKEKYGVSRKELD